MLTHSTVSGALSATVPVVLPRPRPTDIVDDIRRRLGETADAEKQVELLSLGIDVLRRRQAERGRGRR